MKKILITGANSYIGTSVENWLLSQENYEVVTLDVKDTDWKKFDFSPFDSVFHVAGIAHFSKDESKKDLYYQVNTDLTAEVAKKAKNAGVAQFIFMSSIIIYGDSSSAKRIIGKDTVPTPSDFYGDSKWQAEKRISPLESDNFKVVIVRPPMIFGKGSKGNYPKLARLAKKTPFFPDFPNQRSMLHIDNLCAFIQGVIDHESNGIFYPQNKEYVNTSELVSEIANFHGRKIFRSKILNPIIQLFFGFDTVKKVFGNLVYEKEISQYDFEYQVRDFAESVRLTETDGA